MDQNSQAIDRIIRGQAGTVYAYWERDGVAWDPGTTTVTITNDEGAVLVNAAATTTLGTGLRSYDLSPSITGTLDLLTIQWLAGADGSTLTTYAEIVGGFYFSVAQARQRTPLQDTVTYTTQQIIDYRTLAEMAIEDMCGVAFVPRYTHEEAQIASWGMLETSRRRITTVRNIWTQTNNGPQALPTLSGLRIDSGQIVFMPAIWNWWSRPITIAYEHGYPYAPPRVARAALELMRRWVVESPWDERATGFKTREGGEMTILTARTVKAGVTYAFDIPEVAAVAELYGTPLIG
jgi:hypothetical protein